MAFIQAIAACAVVAAAAGAMAQDAPRAAPPMARVGDVISWVTTVNQDKEAPSTQTVDSISPDGDVLTVNARRTRVRVHAKGDVLAFKVFAYDEGAPDHKGAFLEDFSANQPSIDFPIEVGKTWKVARLPYLEGSSNRLMVDGFDARVAAYERITVRAGSFEAFKIEYRGWHNDRTTTAIVQVGVAGRYEVDLWYAPQARAAVLIQSRIYEWKTGVLLQDYRREVTAVKLMSAP